MLEILNNVENVDVRKIMIYLVILLKKNKIITVKSHEEFEKIIFNLDEKNSMHGMLVSAYLYSQFTYGEDGNINELLKCSEQELLKMIETIENNSKFYTATPKEISQLMIEIINPQTNKIMLDLFSGVGAIEDELFNRMSDIGVEGFEISELMVIESVLKSLIGNYNAKYYKENVVTAEFSKKYDYCLSDIPFITTKQIKGKGDFDSKTSFTWNVVFKIIEALKENGRAVVSTFDNCLYNTLDREARSKLINNNYIEKIISLPIGVFRFTAVKTSLIVINKNKRDNIIKFADCSKCLIKEGNRSILDVKKAIDEINNNSIDIEKDEIVKKDYSLNINSYINKIEIDSPELLGNIVDDIFRGRQFTNSEMNTMLVDGEKASNYKILEIGNISEEGEILNNYKYINTKGINLDRYLIKNNDILLSSRGTNTKICLAKINENDRIVANGSIVVIRVKKSKINPIFLKMFLESENGKKTLNGIVVGISIPSLNVGELRKINVPCPDFKKQLILSQKYETKMEIIASTKIRLKQLKDELKNIVDQI